MNETILRVKDLHVSFHTLDGTVEAVRGVTFSLKKGETLALVGESGSGKSVSMKAINRVLPGNTIYGGGEILYEGQDLLKLSEEEMEKIRGRKIAMIFQDPMTSLNPTMNVGRQIAESIRVHEDMPEKEAIAQAIELMKLVGIRNPEESWKNYPHQFSGGMRQRVMIALSLACKPDILIADEPTTALDVTIQSQILDLIDDLKKKLNMSVIFITHDLGVVAHVADKVAVMYAGRIVEIGTAEEIFYNPQHPYTWGLICSMPSLDTKDESLYSIPGAPPNMLHAPKGDAFAPRNAYAMPIDFEQQPPFFKVGNSPTHFAATWLLAPQAPHVTPPAEICRRYEVFKHSYLLQI
ncbi:ABC transporter ATP-binding protein [uncultured Megasphaera sp.]|uniref:ABC transporter ATP-binding protein n=1 Tax=uncultured Megasphaera sp. TaxID=165188 RepID=UPI002657BE27|nr:ABC transporter ATP-binding protein [uncultured Megasphaera sp.]